MCHTQQFDPAATAAGTTMQPTGSPMDTITGGLPSPGPPVTKDTKFGKLLKVLIPIVQGGAIGAFGGNSRQGGSGTGSQAAGNFFSQQAELGLQQQHMKQQLAQNAIMEKYRQSEEQRNQAMAQHLQAEDEAKRTAAGKPPATHVTELAGYPGIALNTEGPDAGKTIRLKQPAPANPNDPSNVTAYGLKSDLPLGPPQSEIDRKATQDRLDQDEARKKKKETEPLPETITDTDEKGVSTSHLIDKNPESPTFGKPLTGTVGTKHPKPTKGADPAKVENYAAAALQGAGNDPDAALARVDSSKLMPSEMKAAVRQRIREMKRPGKAGAGKLDPATLQKLAAGVPGGN